MKAPQILFTIFMAFLIVAATSHGAITLVDSVGFGNTTGSLQTEDGDADNIRTVGASELGTFNANGVDKLVVVIGGEGEGNGTGDNTVTAVTYGGVSMNLVGSSYNGNNQGTTMWYLDNVSVTGSFEITFAENQSGLGFGAYALNGTVAGTAATFVSTTANSGTTQHDTDMSLTTTVPGEFVIGSFARNNQPNPWEAQAPLTELFKDFTDGSSMISAYREVATPETFIPTFVNLTNGAGGILAASFQPIPEPSSLALSMMGFGILWFFRRRDR
jgi:hypothetical protein